MYVKWGGERLQYREENQSLSKLTTLEKLGRSSLEDYLSLQSQPWT